MTIPDIEDLIPLFTELFFHIDIPPNAVREIGRAFMDIANKLEKKRERNDMNPKEFMHNFIMDMKKESEKNNENTAET